MSKSFTVKDFIKYNGPCFNCGNKIFVSIKEYDCLIVNGLNSISSFEIKGDIIEATLKLNYSYILNLTINISNNKYETSNIHKLMAYLASRDIVLFSECKKCKSYIHTESLKFGPKAFILPTKISAEKFLFSDNLNNYTITSDFKNNKTIITSLPKNYNDYYQELISLDISLLPLYKFKTREKILQKIKTLILFS